MTLAEQMQLENLKSQLDPIVTKNIARNNAAAQSAVATVQQEFSAHFKQAGFEISGAFPTSIKAKYQTLEFHLSIDQQPRIGMLALFIISQSDKKKPPLEIRMLRKGPGGPGVTVHVGQLDPLQQMEKAIKDAEADSNGPGPEFAFRVEQPGSTKQKPLFKTFGAFVEVLKEHYK